MPNKNSTPFINEINREYERIDKQWLTLHFHGIIGLISIGLIVQLLLSLTFYDMMQKTMTISFAQYASRYILKPLLLNLGWLCLSIIAMRTTDLSARLRIYLLSKRKRTMLSYK